MVHLIVEIMSKEQEERQFGINILQLKHGPESVEPVSRP